MEYKHLIFHLEDTLLKVNQESISELALTFSDPNLEVNKLLSILKEKQYMLSLITNQPEHAMEKMGYDKYFKYIYTQDSKKADYKEDLSAYRKILNVSIHNSGIEKKETLFISSCTGIEAARYEGVDNALAVWGCNFAAHIIAEYYLETPFELLNILDKNPDPFHQERWLKWAMELQFIAQAGLCYSKDPYDIERFVRIRQISAEMISEKSNLTLDTVENLFCNETGFQTPKMDTRAAIFKDSKILLVKENNGKWSLPGGWMDINESVKTNIIKEVKEESGFDAVPLRLIAVLDRNLHNLPLYAYSVCKIFVLCDVIGGSFKNNIETLESRFFAINEIPPLAEEKNNYSQILMCFHANNNENWKVIFD